jgi:CarD family transcriptional regulator
MVSTTFKVGEKVVYPAHGVGVIEGIQTRVVSGSERKFYMLRILDSDMTIMIPTENVQSVGLRRIIGKDMVAKVYKILRDKKVEIDQQTWNRRYREYTEKIKTGSVLEIAKVLRDLFVLKGDKELSFGERKMLDTARNLLVKELAIAKSSAREDHGRAAHDLRELNRRDYSPACLAEAEGPEGSSFRPFVFLGRKRVVQAAASEAREVERHPEVAEALQLRAHSARARRGSRNIDMAATGTSIARSCRVADAQLAEPERAERVLGRGDARERLVRDRRCRTETATTGTARGRSHVSSPGGAARGPDVGLRELRLDERMAGTPLLGGRGEPGPMVVQVVEVRAVDDGRRCRVPGPRRSSA